MSPFLAVAILLALPALAVLAWVRSKSYGEEPNHRVNGIAWSASVVLSSATALCMMALWDFLPSFALHEVKGWLIAPIVGVFSGTLFYLLMRVVLVGMSTAVHQWTCRLPPENTAPISRRLLVEVCIFAGLVAAMTICYLIVIAQERFDLPTWMLLPIVVSLLPLYHTFLLPWIQYLRAPRLSSYDVGDVEAWLDELSRERRLPPFRIRVHEGRLVNAFATSGFGVHLVVLGATLLERMSKHDIRAVLAHEIAHVEKGHVPKLIFPLTVLCLMLHVVCVISFSNPLFAREEFLPLLAGIGVAAVSAGLFIMCIPGYFLRKMEFQADRRAAEMLGDGEQLVSALTKIAQLNQQPLSAQSWSHPSTQARIDAIRALHLPRLRP